MRMRESVCCNNWYGEDDGDGFGKKRAWNGIMDKWVKEWLLF